MSVSDNFNRSNSSTLGANWTTLTGGGHQIVSNAAYGVTSGVYNWSIWTANTFDATQSSQVTVVSGFIDVGVIVRAGDSAGGGDGYFFQAHHSSGMLLYRRDNGSFTQLQNIGGSVSAGDTIKLEVSGTTLKCFKNAVQQGTDQTDSTYSSGSAGISVVGDNTVPGVDDWIATGEVTGTLTVTAPVQYKVFQRSGGGTANIAITGTYTGSPTAIEASFNGGAFATIDNAPSAGNFSGTLSSQSAGMGTLTCRFTNAITVTGSVANLGIGDVFIVIGDSIAEGRGTNAQNYGGGAPKVTKFTQADTWGDGTDPMDTGTSSGSHWPLLGKLIRTDQSVPVAFVTCGAGSTDVFGSGSDQWAEPNSAYEEMETQATTAATGSNGFKGVLCHLGPNAIVNGTTPSQANYNAALDTLASNIAVDVTGAPKLALAICGEVATGTPPDRRLAEDNVRQAVIEAWGDNSNIRPGPVLVDQDYTDDVHPQSDAALLEVARRWWAAIKEGFYAGAAGFGRGPRLAGTPTIDGTRKNIVLTFDRDLATGTTYGGFRVEDAGSPATITSATRTATRQVTILLNAATSSVGNTTVSFGSDDDAKGQTVPKSTDITLPDSNTIQLPAEPFVDRAVISMHWIQKRRSGQLVRMDSAMLRR